MNFIKHCFIEDEKENIKEQEHTANRIYDRLVSEKNFTGGESIMRRIVGTVREKQSKVFLSLSFEPGVFCK